MKHNNDTKLMTLLAAALLSACGGESDSTTTDTALNQQVRALADSQGLTGDPSQGRALPSIESPQAQLGMQLFFSKGLSGTLDTACVSCHHPFLGGGDDLPLSVGVEADLPDLLGPGRLHSSAGHHFDGGPTVPRNAPSTFNIAFYDDVLFHDGRVESLDKTPGLSGAGGGIRTPDSPFGVADPTAGDNLATAQARFPVTSKEEMRGFEFEADGDNTSVRDHLASRLRGEVVALSGNTWLEAFRTGLEQPAASAETLITYDNVAAALASYQNSQVLVDNPWRAFLAGDDDAIGSDAKQGALLFFTEVANGGAGCSGCHQGDFFTDEQFHVVAMPQIGRGKGDGADGTDDFGRFRETGNPDDRYAFRTPHLLNVADTGPWGHAGGYGSLEAVVRHHLNPRQAMARYDASQLDPSIQVSNLQANTGRALDQLDALQAAGKSKLVTAALDDDQVQQLVAFLNALTDPCVTTPSCMAQWIPEDALLDPDSLRLHAEFQ
ncbi:cytochrome-c peroxidase [Marinobacter sp. CA1]|uniref:cytochrome-c peroxidase n=1 Tax=Marinobacter sp. CA1 TaxID=2817656 RepID=UPI001D06A41F|nr:cytochrome c peroxidase [Marinobacter sp. CA1]